MNWISLYVPELYINRESICQLSPFSQQMLIQNIRLFCATDIIPEIIFLTVLGFVGVVYRTPREFHREGRQVDKVHNEKMI